jgi:hypothetical protein
MKGLILILALAAGLFSGCASLGLNRQTTPDINYQSFSDVDGVNLDELIVDLPAAGIDAANFSDVVKFSHATNVHIRHLVVRTNGRQREQAVDMNRNCTGIMIDVLELDEGLENALTIKGGCDDITIGRLIIHGSGGHCDVEIGGYSTTKGKTTRVKIGSVEHDGAATRVRIGAADWPVVDSGLIDKQINESLALALYVLFN